MFVYYTRIMMKMKMKKTISHRQEINIRSDLSLGMDTNKVNTDTKK